MTPVARRMPGSVDAHLRNPRSVVLVLLGFLLARPVQADLPGVLSARSLGDDPALSTAVERALASLPDLAAAEGRVRAAQSTSQPAGRFPDPVLQVGVEQGTFTDVSMARAMVGVAQALPPPGARDRARDAAESRVRFAQAERDRVRLSTVAAVKRAWLDLLLVQARLDLQARLELLWAQAENLARTAYEAGRVAQSDLLRAQLDRDRLRQRRAALEAEARARRAALTRLVGADPPAPSLGLMDLGDPPIPTEDAAFSEALARSPEMAAAKAISGEAEAYEGLTRAQRWPDMYVSAGVMPPFSGDVPMWQVGLGIDLPVRGRREAAMASAGALTDAAASDEASLRAILRQRVSERVAALDGFVAANDVYRGGLLIRSEATVASTLAQYPPGAVDFTAVLEALAGHLGDVESFLSSVAGAWAASVALEEASLDPVALPGVGSPVAPAGRTLSAVPSPLRTSPPAAAGSAMSGM